MDDHGLHAQGLMRRRLAGAAALLLAGCGGGNTEKDVDAVAPSLQISSDVAGEATAAFTVRFTFTAAVSGFTTDRIQITNGFLNGATLTKLSDTVYTLRVQPATNRQTVAEVRVLAGAFKDAGGAVASTVAYSFSQPIDTVVASNEPELVITHNVSGTTATGHITFTFTFSLDVGTSFEAGDIEPGVGTVTSFNRVSATVYTAVVSPPAGTSGGLLLLVREGKFSSTAGVANLQAYGALVPFNIPA
jgi:hypothetical protein